MKMEGKSDSSQREFDLMPKKVRTVEELRISADKKEKKGIKLNEEEIAQREADALTLQHGKEDHEELTAQYRH